MNKVKVLFVCMGNICRSPTAHGVFQGMVDSAGLGDRIDVDSAGTHAYHVGNPPDGRAQQTALGRGFDLSSQRARQASTDDFERFDYILAMDRDNYENLAAISPGGNHRAELKLFMDFAEASNHPREVPDPYYGGEQGFEVVFDMVEEASRGLLEAIQQKHLG